jgi:hypothetical protein
MKLNKANPNRDNRHQAHLAELSTYGCGITIIVAAILFLRYIFAMFVTISFVIEA